MKMTEALRLGYFAPNPFQVGQLLDIAEAVADLQEDARFCMFWQEPQGQELATKLKHLQTQEILEK